ncbi:MAG: hypothetical protein WCO79_03185 [bacterium]
MRIHQIRKRAEESFWRILTDFWTVVFFSAIVYDYLHENILDHHEIILIIAVLYGASLAIYSAEKEFKRWHDKHETIHPGELYVIAWTLLIFGLIIAGVINREHYEMPAEVRATYVVVVGILALTRESKYLYGKDLKKKKKR